MSSLHVYRFKFTVRAETEGVLSFRHGHWLRGALLGLIKEQDDKLAERLHEKNRVRPYALTPLFIPLGLVKKAFQQKKGMTTEKRSDLFSNVSSQKGLHSRGEISKNGNSLNNVMNHSDEFSEKNDTDVASMNHDEDDSSDDQKSQKMTLIPMKRGFDSFFQLKLLDHSTYQLFTEVLASMDFKKGFFLDDVRFSIRGINFEKVSIPTPWIRSDEDSSQITGSEALIPDGNEIFNRTNVPIAGTGDWIVDLKFWTPTHLNALDRSQPVLFPSPHHVLGNIIRLIDAFHPEKGITAWLKQNALQISDFLLKIKDNVHVVAYRLMTEQSWWGKTVPFVGFKGWVRWKLRVKQFSVDEREWLRTTLIFGTFSQVGRGRTMGNGCYVIESS